ncbi:unnamed protein product [Rotaria sordida]|uniref:Uncharacterized protein n=1 Tax=Rotaria sordida TaxID=392033 RepID=A0A818UZB9_9BILA|nr:unnamed protein product [Rotaria sordida]
MNYHLILFYLISFIFQYTNSVNINTGFTDALTLEEYEDDVELIKIRFDTTRPCRFFYLFIFLFRHVKICQTFCDELYKNCKTAEFSGNIIGTLYKSGLEFCEANHFNVVTNDCFKFDENVFSSAPYLFPSITFLFSLVNLCLVII